MTRMYEQIKYQTIWGRLYVLLGVLFGLLFIFGALILSDFTILFNLIAAAIVIYIGYGMLNRPYAKYNGNEIIVYGLTGSPRKHYKFESVDKLTIQQNTVYLDGKKLKINSWIVEKGDWKRFIRFIKSEQGIEELRD